MSVERTHVGYETRFDLRQGMQLSCVLTYTAEPGEPAIWKILLPGPNGTLDLYATEQTPNPNAAWLRGWLEPIVGSARAAELAVAVDAAPPSSAAWHRTA